MISDIIKKRLKEKNKQFYCNDNISEFINDGELDLLVEEVTEKYKDVLSSLIIDIDNDPNSKESAKRIAKMLVLETMNGRFAKKPKITSFPNSANYDQLYLVGPITVRSVCSHHFQNITGKCYIGVFPGSDYIGLSKYNRLVDWISTRPTLQEELTIQIADEIEKETQATGVAVVIKASHGCVLARGVKESESDMTTSVLRGVLREDPVLRQEFFGLLNGMKGYSK